MMESWSCILMGRVELVNKWAGGRAYLGGGEIHIPRWVQRIKSEKQNFKTLEENIDYLHELVKLRVSKRRHRKPLGDIYSCGRCPILPFNSSTPGHNALENPHMCAHRNSDMNVYSSIIYDGKNWEQSNMDFSIKIEISVVYSFEVWYTFSNLMRGDKSRL